MKKEEKFNAPSIKERETILRYDDFDHAWHVYTDVPKHIRKLQALLDPKKDIHTGVDNSGRVTMIEGMLADSAHIIMSKKARLTPEQRAKAAERLKKYREAHNG